MVDAVLSFAAQKLSEFIAEKWAVLSEVRSNAKWLLKELEYMQSTLKDAQENQKGDYRVRQWVSDVENIAQETIDVLDNYKLQAPKTSKREIVKNFVGIGKKKDMYDIGKQIISLKERVQDLSIRRKTYGINNFIGSTSGRTFRRTTSYMKAGEIFVGFEDDKFKLFDEILKEEPRLGMVSIHGMGGLGKTALARNLYNSKEILSRFSIRGWVCVSQEYNTLDLLRSVIKSFKKGCANKDELEMLEKMKEDDLERYLRELLKDITYLVVIDDVWDRKVWENLKGGFPDYGNGSRVIITTRKNDVATRTSELFYSHHLRFLNLAESKELFYTKFSHRDMRANSRVMRDLAEEMVAKCAGLPLAVVVLSGLLAHKQSPEAWGKVKGDLWSHLMNDSDEISQLFSLSYNDLPNYLKQCFLYVSMLFRGNAVHSQQIIYLWIAEDFIPLADDMEEIAKTCINELINSNLIQVKKDYWIENVFYDTFHDLLLNLAAKEAAKVDLIDMYNPDATQNSLRRIRRHFVHIDHVQRYLTIDDHSKTKLRSLICRNPRLEMVLISPALVNRLGKYNQLCVLFLDLGNVPDELLKFIGNMTQLKLLALRTTTTIYLPASIGNLINLQTFDIYGDGSCILPLEISKLKMLRYLYCKNMETEAEIGALSNLRYLIRIRYEDWSAIQTQNLVNLRELTIHKMERQNGKAYSLESISMLKSLETLSLIASEGMAFPSLNFISSLHKLRSLSLEGKIKMLPHIEKWPNSITELILHLSKLEEDPIPIFERLPNLKRLFINKTFESDVMSFGSKGFPQLEQLVLCQFCCLKKLEFGEGALSMIKGIYIHKCNELKDMNIPYKFKSVIIHGHPWQFRSNTLVLLGNKEIAAEK